MPLSIRSVRSLEDVIQPAVDFLSRPVDLFARQRIVVSTAGAKAWLTAELAARLGVSRGSDGKPAGDGIIAHVEFSYPGTISSLLSEDARPATDPWDVDHLTFTLVEVLADDPAFEWLIQRAGGPLLAARRIADRFDHYHFRRPGMILEWEGGKSRLSPEADQAGNRIEKRLAVRDLWQFDLWRKVRAKIGEPSPPARERKAAGPAPEAVLVAGLQGLSLHQIALLERLSVMPTKRGAPCHVEVLLVHPSPPLRETWAAQAPPLTKDIAPARGEPEPAGGADPLVDAWLRGTREAQWLLASQGLEAVHDSATAESPLPADASLLARLKHTVATGKLPTAAAGLAAFTTDDQSVRIHRCHDLGRQAEVLHDAVLHAFREIKDLAPHEVVILSPQIAKLAPHLEAVFNRDVTGDETDGTHASLHLPLLVADRGIREVSRGAELLSALIALVGSRCSVDGMLAVAAHPLVLAHFGLDDKHVETWQRCIARTKIRWGLDAARRGRGGLDRHDLAAHTWRLGLERMLLGAAVPDGQPAAVLGGVVPLRHVDAADISSLAPLVTIFGLVDDLDQAITAARSIGAWCDLLEEVLGQLAGVESDELAVPLRELDRLRRSAAAAEGDSPADVAVPWHDLKTILAATLTAPVGRQPLRTGVITATSLIPLRGVPFRVVCLAGYDDDAVAPREGDSEDLVDRQQLLGDKDRGLDVRRELLDCMLAARDRLVITCTGMDVKNNKTLPLVTALAEFTDFIGRHGVPTDRRDGERFSKVEIVHPRHACSRGNFVAGEQGLLQTDVPWSHDAAALAAARALGQEPEPRPRRAASAPPAARSVPAVIDLESLAAFMHDPLWPYVHETLGINTWRDDDLSIPATLPLELEPLEKRRLRNDYIDQLIAADDGEALARAWAADAATNGDVPVLGFGEDAVAEITQFSAALLELAATKGVPLTARDSKHDSHSKPVALRLDGITLTGELERCYPDSAHVQTIVLLRPDAMKSSSRPFLRAKMLAVVQLLAARAQDQPIEKALILNQHEDWFPGATRPNGSPLPAAQDRTVKLDDSIDSSLAKTLLSELCGLYQRAAAAPHGCFGDTSTLVATDTEAAQDAFVDFTRNRDYATSSEIVVYGAQPDFADVFPPDPLLHAFFIRFAALTKVVPRYRYAPDVT